MRAQEMEQPFELDRPMDISLSIGALALATSSYVISLQVEPLTSTQLQGLNPASISNVDRSATNKWRPRVARTSDVLLIVGMLSPTALLASNQVRSDIGLHVLMGAETFFLTYGLTQTAKVMILRNRPLTYIESADPELLALQMKSDARFSFFSGHSSMTATMCWYTATVFDAQYPNSAARPYIWAAAAALPGVVGWMRVRSGKHFPTDVIVGYLVGAAIGWGIPKLHQRFKKRR